MLGVDLESVISNWIRLPAIGPVVLDGNDELISSSIVGSLIQVWLMINIICSLSEYLSIHIIFVDRESDRGLNKNGGGPASLRNCRMEVGLHREIEVSVLCWHRHLISRKSARVAILIIPVIRVAFTISVVSNLVVIEAGKEVSSVNEEDTRGCLGCQGINTKWDLGLIVRGPAGGVLLVPSSVIGRDAPWVSNHIYFVINSATGL